MQSPPLPTMGIDIGKNSFDVDGSDQSVGICDLHERNSRDR
jgi:hypothetical protein